MARTGRFGRLPTEAPDLSSQIVSLMEQWMNAEDNNILDAWENGGKYKGKKVTDKDILAHYRKRRNSYDKDDPEWDQWNQDLFQIRFRVSNEKVMMRYAQGKIGPTAVAAHYRQWARKMPKNSSYYRSLMATAGDYAKAARSASQQGGSAFDYDAMMRRHNNIQRDIDRGERVIGALDVLAQNKGLIPEGATLTDPGVLSSFEARELDLWLTSGSPGDEDWKVVVQSIQKEFPGFDGNLTSNRVMRMIEVVIDGKKRQIRNLNRAPYDTSSQKAGLRNDIRGLENYRDMVEAGGGLDAGTAAANAFDRWYGTEDTRAPLTQEQRGTQTGFINSTDPADLLDGNDTFRHNLRRYYKDLTKDGRDQDAAHAEAMRHMLEGDVDWLRNYEGTSNVFGPSFSTPQQLMEFAATIAYVQNGIELAAAGDAVLYFDPDPLNANERLLSPGQESLPFQWKSLRVNPATGRHAVEHDGQKVIPYQMSDGTWTHAMYEGTEVVDGDTGENLGFVWDINGFTMYGRRTEDGFLTFDDVNPWNEDIGEELTKTKGGGYTVTYSEERFEQAASDNKLPVSTADIMTDVEAMEQYVLEVQAMPDVSAEVKAQVVEGNEQLVRGDFWDDPTKVLTDPALMDAFVQTFPSDFEVVDRLGWTDTEYVGDVTEAVARDVLRRRFDLADKVPVTEEEMRFLTPMGGVRTAEYYDPEEAQRNAADSAAKRDEYVQSYLDQGMTYGQAMRQMRVSVSPYEAAFMEDAFVRGAAKETQVGGGPYDALYEANREQTETLLADGRGKDAIKAFSQQLREGTGSEDFIVELMKSDPLYFSKMTPEAQQLVYSSMAINSVDDATAARSVEAMGRMRAFTDFETPAADVLNNGGDYDVVRAGAEFSLTNLFEQHREDVAKEFRGVTSEGIEGEGWDIDAKQPQQQRTDVFRAYGEMRNIPGVTPLDITQPLQDPITSAMTPRASQVAPWMATTKPPVERKDPSIKVSSTLAGLTNLGPVSVSGQPIKVAQVGGSPIGIGSVGVGSISGGQPASSSVAYTDNQGIHYPQGRSPNVTPR